MGMMAKVFSARYNTGTYAISFFNYAIPLVVIAILVNFYPDTYIWNLWDDGYKLSYVAIVTEGYFNIVFGIIISSGILMVVLNYFQVTKPEREEQARIEEQMKN